jgi:ACS family sodium-dependent inorganic phosphate cotransporter
MCGLLFLAETICYADRTNITLAAVKMQKTYHYSTVQLGWVFSSFFFGYICTQLLGGWASKRYGGKIVLTTGVCIWSLATALTPLCASISFPTLIACRVFMGLGEGVTVPCVEHLVAEWAPRSERTRFITFATSGQIVGTLLAYAFSPLVEYRWEDVFYIFGAFGAIWVLVWSWYATSSPDDHHGVSNAEKAHIQEGKVEHIVNVAKPSIQGFDPERKKLPATKYKPWRQILTSPACIGIIVAQFTHNWGWYLLLSWLPTYFKQSLHIEVGTSGLLLLAPYTTQFVCCLFAGWLADRLILGGGCCAKLLPVPLPTPATTADATVTTITTTTATTTTTNSSNQGISATAVATLSVRKGMTTVGLCGPALALVVLVTLTVLVPSRLSVATAVILMCICVGLGSFSYSGWLANVIDIAPNHAGLLMGISNTIGTIPGILGNLTTGYILQRTSNNYNAVWLIAITLYVVGWSVYMVLAKAKVEIHDARQQGARTNAHENKDGAFVSSV